MTIRVILATVGLLSCALLVAPSAYQKNPLAKRDGYEGDSYDGNSYGNGNGYGGNGNGYDSNGGYSSGGNNGNDGGNNGNNGGQQGNNVAEIILALPLADREGFCADYLGYTEPATTIFETTTEYLATVIQTSSATTDLGIETIVDSVAEDTTVIPNVVDTTTELSTTTSTQTDSFTSTTTTFLYTAPAPPPPVNRRRRAHAAARKRMQSAAQKRVDLPVLPAGLSTNDAPAISSVCSGIVMPLTAYTSATTMVDLTWTQTITITSTLGPIPTTTTVLFTTTEMPESTLTDSTTTLEATTTATTDMPVSTLCAASMPVQQIGIASDGGKVEIVTAIASANDCCLACFMPGPSQPPGCGAWQFDAAAGGVCQIASGAKGPDASVNGQCPAGSGRYIVVGGGAFIGGDGPCSGGHYSGVTAPPS